MWCTLFTLSFFQKDVTYSECFYRFGTIRDLTSSRVPLSSLFMIATPSMQHTDRRSRRVTQQPAQVFSDFTTVNRKEASLSALTKGDPQQVPYLLPTRHSASLVSPAIHFLLFLPCNGSEKSFFLPKLQLFLLKRLTVDDSTRNIFF